MPNRDDVIRMAREAGISEQISLSDSRLLALERFAKLVAAQAAAEEREACAKVCDLIQSGQPTGIAAYVCASAIRARGKA